jgi:uncharacterized Zn finger protein
VKGIDMARSKNSVRSRSAKAPATANSWLSLTWDDLDSWAGGRSVSRGQDYQRQGRVKRLALSKEGRLLATVVGNERYVTTVWLDAGDRGTKQINSTCSCPVGATCKHAVAVVAEYLVAITEQRIVAAADPDDPRWTRLSGVDADSYDFDEDADFEEEEVFGPDEDEDESHDGSDISSVAPLRRIKPSQSAHRQRRKRLSRAEWDQKIKLHLEQQDRDDLAKLVSALVKRFPELRQELQDRISLEDGEIGELLTAARRELRQVTTEFGWRNQWTGEGHTPDYRSLEVRLRRLADSHHYDAVVEFSRELMERGMEQVGQSNDEGETANALSDCLPVVFEALEKSSLPAPDKKIIYAIDACLHDDYDLIRNAAARVLDAKWQAAD